jgi:serine/threonine-protein kinase
VGLVRIGQYILQQRLNEGGIAEVYLATDAQDHPVALRRLRPNLKFHYGRRSEFQRGMQIQMEIHGPYVAQVLELQTRVLVPYAAMEYIEGINLRQAMMRRNEFLPDYETTFLIFERLAKGLGGIHHCGYMHLDMKPENVLLNHNRGITILDFDLARTISQTPKALSSVDGTPAYLAPEILLSEPVDERADIFALGILGYELFTQQKPVSPPTQAEVLRANCAISSKFPPATNLNPSLPKAMSDVLSRCVEKRLELRYPAIQVLLRDMLKIRPENLAGS